jgi:hypothetical protein
MHHILRFPTRPQFALVEDEPSGMREPWLMGEGAPMGENFPRDAQLRLSDGHKGQKLDDFISNPLAGLAPILITQPGGPERAGERA